MPLDIETQISKGWLVCPKTRQPLSIVNGQLTTPDGEHSYPYVNGVPILIDPKTQAGYMSENDESMVKTYSAESSEAAQSPRRGFVRPLLGKALRPALGRVLNTDDYRSEESREAERLVHSQPADALCLEIGGGGAYGRNHPQFVTVNLGPFKDVDVVADAYALPYRDNTVSAIMCEAVLEHLEFPEAAVKEMHRVLVPGGQVFAATPFLQIYHGYPNHFQNFTLTGQQRLFTRNGFELASSGVCVGPTWVVSQVVQHYWKYYAPPPLKGNMILTAMSYAFALIRRLDKKVVKLPQASDIASTTYVHAKKPHTRDSRQPSE